MDGEWKESGKSQLQKKLAEQSLSILV